MKKIFLSAVIAMALCSYGYAQDEDEYEEDEAPAKVSKAPAYEEEEEDDVAPAPKKADKKKAEKKSSPSGAFFGAGIDIGGLLENNQVMRLTFRLADNMELSGILGFWHHGATTETYNAPLADGSTEKTLEDNNTYFGIGVGFDFFLTRNIVSTSVGGEFIFSMPNTVDAQNDDGEPITVKVGKDVDVYNIKFNVLAGGHAELVSGLVLTGKIGLSIDYNSASVANLGDRSYLDFGLATKVYLTWFMF